MSTKVTLFAGDNRVSLANMPENSVDSVVTDSPYGLVSLVNRFGKEGAKPARTEKNDGSFSRLSKGFMGKVWDGTGIERDPEFWKLVYRVLKPGGYVFAFSGSRTGHWQACAMELAGFIMHPMHGWCYGSGFPKAHNAAKAIDKALGVEGGFVAEGNPVKRMIPGADQHSTGSWEKNNGRQYQPGSYVPGSPEAAEWEGWAYGTQAQKPALEPIYLGQKPFDCKTGAANLLKHGVGAVNIDGCRVPAGEDHAKNCNRDLVKGIWGQASATASVRANAEGRHPANLILDGSPEVVAMFPDSGGSGKARTLNRSTKDRDDGYGMDSVTATSAPLRDAGSGSAARFFHHFPPDMNPLFYNGKAGKTDRAGSKHPTVKPIALMQYLIRHITPPGGTVLDPFAGSGTTGEAAKREGVNCILMEAEPEYIEFLEKRFDIAKPEFDFDDILGEALPTKSTNSGDTFHDILGN